MTRVNLAANCLTILLALAGCQPAEPPAAPPAETAAVAATADHEHAHGAGPHGGVLTDWGGGAYHVEFTVDHDQQQATVYLLGSDEKSPAPVAAESIQLIIDEPATEVSLAPLPLEGESEGTASRFQGQHETLGMVREFSGTISGVVDGTPYTGDFAEVAADHAH